MPINRPHATSQAMRAVRSIGECAVKQLILMHQNPQTLSTTLWAAIRQRGCQFLGPAMQEKVLCLIVHALKQGISLSWEVLVLFVVQRLDCQFTQASIMSIGHVVQLLYRASCLKFTGWEGDTSLWQLQEKYRTYSALRKEHDAQIVQIAMEADLHFSPEQWSVLLYANDERKSHMQSIIDKLQTPASFASSIQELIIALQRTNDPHNLQNLRSQLDKLTTIDPSPEAVLSSWEQLQVCLQSLLVFTGLQSVSKECASKKGGNLEGAQMINRKYRTGKCHNILQKDSCPRGSNCNFAHTVEELEKYRKCRKLSSGIPSISHNGVSAYPNSRAGSSSSPDCSIATDLDNDFEASKSNHFNMDETITIRQQHALLLWAAVRQRGCKFLGPTMQKATLRLVVLLLEDGISLSRKVLVLFIVQRLERQFIQASKTSIVHVVELLFRASCFKVIKREDDSSLLQLHEEIINSNINSKYRTSMCRDILQNNSCRRGSNCNFAHTVEELKKYRKCRKLSSGIPSISHNRVSPYPNSSSGSSSSPDSSIATDLYDDFEASNSIHFNMDETITIPQKHALLLWAAVRQKGCQCLGPTKQEAVLRLIVLSLEDGILLSKKVLALFVMQRLEKQFIQASETSIGHVVELLYRASCFKVIKREDDSSLLQLHEELQTPVSFASSIQELILVFQRTNDPHNLQNLMPHLDKLSAIDPSPEAVLSSWEQLQECLQSLLVVVTGLLSFSKEYARENKCNLEGAQCPWNADDLMQLPAYNKYYDNKNYGDSD